MSETTEYDIGSQVSCSDGVCGELRRVVVDPVARALTHLVVEPRYRPGSGHLVPIDLVASTTGGITLSCTTSQFEALEDAQETQFLPGAAGEWGYGEQDALSLPYFALRMGGIGMGMGDLGVGDLGSGTGLQASAPDRVPAGEVEVRRGDHVHATDGAIGRVRGLVIDPSDHQVTHVLLDEGHLWGHKRIAIPISAVTDIRDGVRLNLSKDQVRDLPAVELDQPD